MNKRAVLLLVAAPLILGQSAVAQFVGDPGSVNTVADVKKMKNNAWFTMEGTIVRQTREEKYLFRDQSGEIEVEIDNDDWRGLKVDANMRIRIAGEVEKEFMRGREVDVKSVELVGTTGSRDGASPGAPGR